MKLKEIIKAFNIFMTGIVIAEIIMLFFLSLIIGFKFMFETFGKDNIMVTIVIFVIGLFIAYIIYEES